jgi:hypothetical protein
MACLPCRIDDATAAHRARRPSFHDFAAKAVQDPTVTTTPSMLPEAGTEAHHDRPLRRAGLVLWGAAGLCLLAAGLVLWNARGAAVFTDVLAAAIAWCF